MKLPENLHVQTEYHRFHPGKSLVSVAMPRNWLFMVYQFWHACLYFVYIPHILKDKFILPKVTHHNWVIFLTSILKILQ